MNKRQAKATEKEERKNEIKEVTTSSTGGCLVDHNVPGAVNY